MYWEPKKGSITIGKPYKHSTEVDLPIDYVPSYKVMTLPFAATTVKFDLKICSEMPIERIAAFKGSRFFRLKNSGKRIAEKGESIRWTRAPLPILLDRNNAQWEIKNAQAGDTYFVVVYF